MARLVMHPQAFKKMDIICSRLADQVGDAVHLDAVIGAPIDLTTVPPHKRGALKASIHGIPLGKRHLVVVGTDWWMFPEYGTSPHVIASHGTWQLRNRWVGKKFGWVVNHPGMAEQAYMRKAIYQKRHLSYVPMI